MQWNYQPFGSGSGKKYFLKTNDTISMKHLQAAVFKEKQEL